MTSQKNANRGGGSAKASRSVSSSSFSLPGSTLSSFLRELRVRTGLSRLALSEWTGISHAMIENFECNKVTPLDSHLRALALALGIDVSELLARTGNVGRSAQ